MPDPAKEKALKAYNNIEIWVEAGNQRLSEHVIAFDDTTRRHRNCSYAPLDKPFSVHIAVRSKGPILTDLVFDNSFDGRTIHPTYVERGNHTVTRIAHFFNMDDGVSSKFPFIVGDIETSNDAMLPVPSDDVGEIRIDVYKTTLVKSRKGKEKMCEPSELLALKIHERDVGARTCCIRSGPAQPCTNEERRSMYRPSEPYKSAREKPLITFVYEYHERMDDTGGEDTKGGITEALSKRTRPGDQGTIAALTTDLAEVRKDLRNVMGKINGLVKETRRSKRKNSAVSVSGASGDSASDDEDGAFGGGSPSRAGSPLSYIGRPYRNTRSKREPS